MKLKLYSLLLIPVLGFAAPIEGVTHAPEGNAKTYTPTVGHAKFEYEIHNHSNIVLNCIVTRRACMNNLHDCVEETQTYRLTRHARHVDHGSHLAVPVTYQRSGEAYTTSYLFISDCGAPTFRATSYAHYHVTN